MPGIVKLRSAAAILVVATVACGGGGGGGGGPDAEQQQMVDRMSPAATAAAVASGHLEDALSSHRADPVDWLVAALRSDPSVASVERYDEDGSIIATMKTGSSFSVALAEKNRAEWAPAGALLQIMTPGAPGALLAEGVGGGIIVCDQASFPKSKAACIVDVFQGEFMRNYAPIRAAMTRAGFTPTMLSLETPQDILTLRGRLPSCGILYLASHGVRGKNIDGTSGNQLVTEIPMSSSESIVDMMAALGGDMSTWVGVTAHKGQAFWTLTPEFFASVKYPNTLVYADMCSSDAALPGTPAAQLKDAFRGNGAGAFLGWKGPINAGISNTAADEIFDGLAPDAAAAAITGINVTPTPVAPSAGEPYTVSASVEPPGAGVELRLGVSGTDGYNKDERQTTDASGRVTFSPVPGGAGGVTDTVTVSAGGAGTSSTVHNVVLADPILKNPWRVPYLPLTASISAFSIDAESNFNLACNNAKLTSTKTIVKFSAAQGAGGSGSLIRAR